MTPDTHRIIYTRHDDGGVSVVRPFEECLAWMGCGGYWNDRPRGFLDELMRRKTCPILQKGKPATVSAAWKFIKAMQFGGLTTPERWDVIRAHDCERHGHTIDAVPISELPRDRWFRNAWTRGHNGGPIRVDLAKARAIQIGKIDTAIRIENKRRREALHKLPALRIDLEPLRSAIRNARDDEELRRVWPCSLSLPH